MLKDCGLDLVELGHSERREHFGETDKTVGLKVEAAVRHGLIPLICIGESLADRDNGRADEILARQARTALARLGGAQPAALVLLVYEPICAIGEKGFRLPPITPKRARGASPARRWGGCAVFVRRQRQSRQLRGFDAP